MINISSPNTEGLRELFAPSVLPGFLKSLKACVKGGVQPARQGQRQGQGIRQGQGQGIRQGQGQKEEIPLILKISPDESDKDFIRIMDQSLQEGIDGWCICNSSSEESLREIFLQTRTRAGLKMRNQTENQTRNPTRLKTGDQTGGQTGGVSGKLLANRSLHLLKKAKNWLEQRGVKDKLLLSCGGVLTAEDVLMRLEQGADLVQVYSALVFEGPGFFHSVFKELSSRS